MNLKQKMQVLRNMVSGNVEGKSPVESDGYVNISYNDKVKLLSLFYTFNHGDKLCNPVEYSFNCGRSANGGGNFSKLEEEFSQLGYTIEDVICYNIVFKDKMMKNDFEQRKQTRNYSPSDIQCLILSTMDGKRFCLMESPETLKFLAESGDERAIGTYNYFVAKAGAPSLDNVSRNHVK